MKTIKEFFLEDGNHKAKSKVLEIIESDINNLDNYLIVDSLDEWINLVKNNSTNYTIDLISQKELLNVGYLGTYYDKMVLQGW